MAVSEGIKGHILRLLGSKKEPPILQDAPFLTATRGRQILDQLMEIFAQSKIISYQIDSKVIDDRWLLGVHPGLKMSF